MYLNGEKTAREFEKYLARCMKRRKLEPREPESAEFVVPVSKLLTMQYACGGYMSAEATLNYKRRHYLYISLHCPAVAGWLVAHCPASHAAQWPLATTHFLLMESSDRVLTWMTSQEITQKVRTELHPLLDAALLQADALTDQLRAIADVEALDAALRNDTREWKSEYETKVAIAAVARGPAAAIEAGQAEITAWRERGAVPRVLAPWEAWMQRLQAELH